MCPKWGAQRASAPRFWKFTLLVNFSDTLLVVSILSMIAICSGFCCPGGVINSSCGNYEGRFVGSKWRSQRGSVPRLPRFILLVSFSDTCGFDFVYNFHCLWSQNFDVLAFLWKKANFSLFTV